MVENHVHSDKLDAVEAEIEDARRKEKAIEPSHSRTYFEEADSPPPDETPTGNAEQRKGNLEKETEGT